jgi:predicted dehydrogenase
MTNQSTSRRGFLKTSATATAAAAATSCLWPHTSVAAAEKPKSFLIAQIGCGGMGRGDAGAHGIGGRIAAICDVDKGQTARAMRNRRIGGHKPEIFTEYRRVLDRKDIDVVGIGTPDHWHVKIAIEALQAGKHVFCQKPLTLTLEENQLCRAAAKKYNKQVFFVGTQQRSDAGRFLRAVNMVQKGLLGKMKKVTVGINGGARGGPFEKKTPPASLDWNTWLGQTPKVDYIPERCHGSFRWWYEYSGGKFTDWGAHHVDIATWALGRDKEGMGPVEFDGTDANHPVPFKDGYPTVDNAFNTAHDYAVKCKFDDGVEMVITSRGDNGITFEGTKGKIFVNRGKVVGKPIQEKWDEGKYTNEDQSKLYKGKPREGHKHNFYRCIREGGLPVSDVFSHVQAMNTCHLAAIAARVGGVIKWDPKAEKISGNDVAAGLFARPQRKGFEIPRV